MKAPFFVEVVHRGREVRRRYRVDCLPIRLGRAYDNDIILDDPHAAPHHAVVEESDEGLALRDLETRNGILHQGKRLTELRIDGNTLFRLGHTTLRVRPSDFSVPVEIPDRSFHKWEGWPPAVAGIFLLLCVALISTWMSDSGKFELLRYLVTLVTTLSVGLLWCGGWAFANRLFGGSARLGRHLFILGCGVAAVEACSFAGSLIAYAFSFEAATRYGSHLLIVVFAVMLFCHLIHIRPAHARTFAATGACVAFFVSVLVLMTNYSTNGTLADELFMHEKFPPTVRLSPDRPVSVIISSAAGLKAKVDAERSQPVAGADGELDD